MAKEINAVKKELQSLFAGQKSLLYSLLPPIFFVIINTLFDFDIAMWSSLILGVLMALFRVTRGQSVFSSLGGVGGVILAILITKWIGSNEGFFLPSIVGNGFWVLAFVISIVIRKPVIAIGSHFLRKWPLEWYWHPKIRPAYLEVSLVWLLFLSLRLYFQVFFYLNQAVDELAIINLFTGTPATITLLVFSYVYGKRRLKHLGGPNVTELQAGDPAPWTGLHSGF